MRMNDARYLKLALLLVVVHGIRQRERPKKMLSRQHKGRLGHDNNTSRTIKPLGLPRKERTSVLPKNGLPMHAYVLMGHIMMMMYMEWRWGKGIGD